MLSFKNFASDSIFSEGIHYSLVKSSNREKIITNIMIYLIFWTWKLEFKHLYGFTPLHRVTPDRRPASPGSGRFGHVDSLLFRCLHALWHLASCQLLLNNTFVIPWDSGQRNKYLSLVTNATPSQKIKPRKLSKTWKFHTESSGGQISPKMKLPYPAPPKKEAM